MRIAILSDIHSNYHALEAVLQDITRRGTDQTICLGDLTLKGPLPKECVDRIRGLGCPVVLGNADGSYDPDFEPSRYPAQNKSQAAIHADWARHVRALTPDDRAWLHSFPLSLTQTREGVRMEFFHATPGHNYKLTMPWAPVEDLLALRSSAETTVAALGHCHWAYVRFAQGLQVINPGSVGLPFDGDPRPSYAMLEVGGSSVAATIIRVPYDAEKAIQAAKDVGMQGWELFAHTARTGRFPG